MKEILKLVITNLVENQDAVEITEKLDGNTIVFEVKVEQVDMGRVIGKQGKIAKAIRTVIKAISFKENKKVLVEFVD